MTERHGSAQAAGEEIDDIDARLLLLSLPKSGPARLAWLLEGRTPAEVVAHLRKGRLPADLKLAPRGLDRSHVEAWIRTAATLDIGELRAAHEEKGVELLTPAHRLWPFAEDPEPPLMLFCQGDVDLLDVGSGVAVVGTRRCTGVGRKVAYRLGFDLADAGCPVVSGLAIGVDGAAHRGALDAGGVVIGVVGTGLDVVYPRSNQELWSEVAAEGLLVSELPLGSGPTRWRFPARNRMIAGLSDGVVVVESHATGGALSTVDEAVDRSRAVMAVPGSVLSRASEGTNTLLVDGAVPVRSADDVIGHLGLPVPRPERVVAANDEPDTDSTDGRAVQAELPLSATAVGFDQAIGGRSPLAEAILAEAATGPVHIDRLATVADASVPSVLAEVERMRAEGLISVDGSTVSL